MGKSNGTIEISNTTLEQVQEFHNWLQGKSCPECLHSKAQPHLTEDESFSVIYFLQEILEILPDKYEKCRECHCIFDSENEGSNIDADSTVIDEAGNEINGNYPENTYGLYCDDCRPD